MAERSFKSEVKHLRLGEGDTFTGEGILAITKALLENGVGYVGGYQGAPISHLMDVLSDAEELLEEFNSREKVKGEVVLVIGPKIFHKMDSVKIDKYLHYELQTRSVKDTVEILSKTLSLSKRVLYDRALVVKNKLTK